MKKNDRQIEISFIIDENTFKIKCLKASPDSEGFPPTTIAFATQTLPIPIPDSIQELYR